MEMMICFLFNTTGTQCLLFQTMFLTIRADIDSMGFKFTEIIPVCILNGNRNGDSEVGAETLRLYT